MRPRSKLLANLEGVYREAFGEAEKAGDPKRMEELDFGFRRDQVMLEVLLDVRDGLERLDGLARKSGDEGDRPREESSLLDKVRTARRLTKLVPR